MLWYNNTIFFEGGFFMNRNIGLCIVYSIITLGIYSFYWMYKLNEETAAEAGREPTVSGGLLILLTIVTCGIYFLYWCYKQGEYMTDIYTKHGQQANNPGTLYLILGLFTFIIALVLIQNDLNKFVPAQ